MLVSYKLLSYNEMRVFLMWFQIIVSIVPPEMRYVANSVYQEACMLERLSKQEEQ